MSTESEEDYIKFRGYDRSYSYEEIAEALGLSTARVKEIERRALIKLLYSHGRFLKDLYDNN
jgi:DNA-directed RNA polymerase sigma subunit (sigma70/sigma32)